VARFGSCRRATFFIGQGKTALLHLLPDLAGHSHLGFGSFLD